MEVASVIADLQSLETLNLHNWAFSADDDLALLPASPSPSLKTLIFRMRHPNAKLSAQLLAWLLRSSGLVRLCLDVDKVVFEVPPAIPALMDAITLTASRLELLGVNFGRGWPILVSLCSSSLRSFPTARPCAICVTPALTFAITRGACLTHFPRRSSRSACLTNATHRISFPRFRRL